MNFKISDCSIGYRAGSQTTVIASDIEMEIRSGELVSLIGANGCGKSTLIRTLAGLQPALGGSIQIDGCNLASMDRKMRAQKMSVVLTDNISVPNTTVHDIVALGRFPYTNWYGILSEHDEEIILQSIQTVGLQDFAYRNIDTLSDGERQRVMIAKALAQDSPFILLDEPTAHLDVQNRIEVMNLLKKLTVSSNKAILLSTHELHLALNVSDSVWIMKKGQPLLSGTPRQMMENGEIAKAFNLSETQIAESFRF